ncbi:hypothetical protein CAPTEDRAFT_179660 [Capitella teleta]|uniref:GH10 domain-containing protein n=1 Tax=Capitella teleta TaxID=283909 RepID=R7TCF4_CAPTE|nr:hypothetical protein CAPTEDRAFT_179660 [Capitella teleta]|eukprot:ELT88741.1 hypothetical protein CAPTEDRAFT_179660 [Capitella teleta]
MDKLYQKFFFKHFNWATITNAMKWHFMEPKKVNYYCQSTTYVFNLIIHTSDRVKVRGHCVTWGKEVKVVTWLKDESPEGVAAAVQRRINNLTDLYSGNISHWDICNEQLHGDWYEQKIQEVRFVDGIFRAMHERDGSAALCTNDYDVCSKGSYTAAYKRQAEQLKARGVPLHVMGIQSHMSERVDIDLIAKRLNKLSEAGVPLFITEMDVREDDIKKRTESYENLLRLYFSHPAVEGIILWGFWDGTLRFPEAAIATGGSSIEWNEAGQRIASLWEDEWRTEETLLTTQREQSFGVRGFYGDYSLELWYDGVHQWSQTFVLQKGRAVAVNVKV